MKNTSSTKLIAWTGSLMLVLGTASIAQEEPVVEPVPEHPITGPDGARTHGLESLRDHVTESGGVPLPSDLSKIVDDMSAAEALGKALFWDMAVGSDGVQACASCHFHAGADSRDRNQLNPNITSVRDQHNGVVRGYHNAPGAGDGTFEVNGPDTTLTAGDYPFVVDPNKWVTNGDIVEPDISAGNSNDVTSSQGVFRSDYVGLSGGRVDISTPVADPIWNVGGVNVRRVEPRNTPTMINAVFNFANFWDGRANNRFNGVSPFGDQDRAARIYVDKGDKLKRRRLSLRNSSLASQAVGPPQSHFEMSAGDGAGNVRPFPDIGRKLLDRKMLKGQAVHPDDSVFGSSSHVTINGTDGLNETYRTLVEAAFNDKYWRNTTDSVDGYSQIELNFSMFFGIAVMVYEATLVSDASPFDQWMEGDGSYVSGFGQDELDGLNVFTGDGRCINCHSGPEFTNVAVRNYQDGNNAIEAMQMGDGSNALYDNGFYNIGVTPTTDDIGRGGSDPNGKPLAFARQTVFQRLGLDWFQFEVIGEDRIGAVSEEGHAVCVDFTNDGECQVFEPLTFSFKHVAVDGAFKAGTIRNTELTGPYFHNGGMSTLRQVVEFYDRGGNFCKFNLKDLDPDIRRLDLTEDQKSDLVAFLVSTTDDRVRRKAGPFDHPELIVPNGGKLGIDEQSIALAAVGKDGGAPLDTFLGLDPNAVGTSVPEDACNHLFPPEPVEEPAP